MTNTAKEPTSPEEYGLAIVDRSDYDTEFDKYVIAEREAQYIQHSREPCHKVLQQGLESDEVHAYKGNTWWINGPEAREYIKDNMTVPEEADGPDVWFLFGHERISGWTSKQALKRALTIAAWEVLGGRFVYQASTDDGVNTQTPTVRLVVSDDPEGYDGSYIDALECVSDLDRAKIRDDITKRIDFFGVVIVCAEWWNGAEWEHADSRSGFIGNEWQGSGHDVDLMQAAMDAYHKPLYILELRKGVWQISEDRNELLIVCGIFEQDPDEFISTIAPAKMRDYVRVDGNLYRRVGP